MGNVMIKTLVLPSVGTNCMLIVNQENKEVVIVDPGDGAASITQAIHQLDCCPAAIFLTHGHYDHIMAVNELRDEYGIQVYAYEEEQDVLGDPKVNLSGNFGQVYSTHADVLVQDGQELFVGAMKFTVLHTPGHTKGGCCYYLPEAHALFSGDTLFAGSVGRMDLPTGSGAEMKNSISRLLQELPEDVDVYPGHMEASTIGHEKRFNPFA